MPLLTSIIGLPLVAALLILCIPGNYRFVIRCLALLATLGSAVLALWMFFAFEPGLAGAQFVERLDWAPALGISYYLGVDGINVGLVLMGAIVSFAAACLSKEIQRHEKEFYLLLLIMSGGILGAFASLDLFFLYFFHELALVPTFIMIGVWGRGERKNYATFQITLYLSVGALVALIGLIALYVQSGLRTFDIPELTRHFAAQPLDAQVQQFIFPWLLFGFGILVSLWPFHTWAPLGYGSAPTATAMLHAGVLKKFGLYGLIRIALPMLPEGGQLWLPVLAWLCLGNLVYCGWVAMRQRDLNLLIGNSSVAHMGFVFLGIASVTLTGVTGAVLVMIAHGFLAALSFGLSGWLYQQTGTLEMSRYGGFLRRLPFVGTCLVMAMFAGCGLPGFANFPGELLVLFGAWKGLSNVVVFAAWGALIIGAIYMLRAIRVILHGDPRSSTVEVHDAQSWWRKLPYALLLACLLLFGIWPRGLTERISPSVKAILDSRAPGAAVAAQAERGPAAEPLP